jgi:hypothetical protein
MRYHFTPEQREEQKRQMRDIYSRYYEKQGMVPGSPKASSKEKNEIGITKGGVLEAIYLALRDGGTVEEIHAKVMAKFPHRPSSSVLSTIRTQLNRMPKEHPVIIKRDIKGVYSILEQEVTR